MTWLLNSMKPSIAANWDVLHAIYSQEKNISRVFELYEKLSLKQDNRTVTDYFALLKVTIELQLYHPSNCDIQT